MAKLSEKALLKRDAKRNIGEDLLQAVEEMKAGRDKADAPDAPTPHKEAGNGKGKRKKKKAK